MANAVLLLSGTLAASLLLLIVWLRNRALERQLRETREMLSAAVERAAVPSAPGSEIRGRTLASADQALETMVHAQEWLALPARAALDALWDWDVVSDRVRFSARWREMVGLPGDEVHRSTEEWWGRVHPSDRGQLHVDIAAQLAGTGTRFSSEHRVRHEDGTWLRLHWAGLILRDEAMRAVRVMGSVRDITAQRSAEERQRREALYDGLTGLPNRSLALDLVRRAIRRTRRQGERRFAVLYVDLDRFNLLNDSLGHTAGDELLRAVSQRLLTAIRPGDVVARLGGDEFLLLLDEITDFADAESVADRVKFVLAEPLTAFSHEVVVSASTGIVLHDPHADDPADYVRDAELAMHEAKRGGRARHARFAPELRDGLRRRVSLEQDLRGAIDRGEFVVLYQPVWGIEGPSERLIGFEALLRWNHPQKGTLGPTEFVPIAEETDLIVTLGGWTLHRACRDLSDFAPDGEGAPWVSVNIAARQLAQRNLVAIVDDALHATRLGPTRLKLEVTENVILHDEEGARETMEALRSRGIRTLMDDFGTGHASLSYLHRLPIGTIKIDRYFVGRMDVSPECLEIVRSIVALGRSLGMELVAEGVEQEAQLDQLRTLGCSAIQGYLLARPLLCEEALALVAALGRIPGQCPREVLRELGISGGYRHSRETPAAAIDAA